MMCAKDDGNNTTGTPLDDVLALFLLVQYKHTRLTRFSILIAVDCELADDENVLDDGCESAHEPREIGENVARLCRGEQDGCRVADVLGQQMLWRGIVDAGIKCAVTDGREKCSLPVMVKTKRANESPAHRVLLEISSAARLSLEHWKKGLTSLQVVDDLRYTTP